MNNSSKIALFVFSVIFLVAFSGFSSAAHPYNTYTYTDRDGFSYSETNEGFRINFDSVNYETTTRGYTYCGFYDWSYGGKRCASSYSNRLYYPDHASYEEYDKDTAIEKAFGTYDNSKKYDHQLKLKELDNQIRLKELELEDRYRRDRYRYAGYGYSGGRYYSYGW